MFNDMNGHKMIQNDTKGHKMMQNDDQWPQW